MIDEMTEEQMRKAFSIIGKRGGLKTKENLMYLLEMD